MSSATLDDTRFTTRDLAILQEPPRRNEVVRETPKQAIPIVSNLSHGEFVNEFVAKRQPVVLKDATERWTARDWTLESIREAVGQRDIETRTPSGTATYQLAEAIEAIAASSPDQPAPYLRNIDIERTLPELWADVRPRISYAQHDWKSSRLLPRDFLFANHLEELFIGGAGATFPHLHVDYWGMDGFVSQIYGEKEFILIEPVWTDHVYPSIDDELTSQIDVNAPDYHRFPKFAEAEVIRLTLHPGDTLYNPGGWWHTTAMHEPSITVITATWHRYNWKTLIDQYRQRARLSRLGKAAMLGYLHAVGAILRLKCADQASMPKENQ